MKKSGRGHRPWRTGWVGGASAASAPPSSRWMALIMATGRAFGTECRGLGNVPAAKTHKKKLGKTRYNVFREGQDLPPAGPWCPETDPHWWRAEACGCSADGSDATGVTSPSS